MAVIGLAPLSITVGFWVLIFAPKELGSLATWRLSVAYSAHNVYYVKYEKHGRIGSFADSSADFLRTLLVETLLSCHRTNNRGINFSQSFKHLPRGDTISANRYR